MREQALARGGALIRGDDHRTGRTRLSAPQRASGVFPPAREALQMNIRPGVMPVLAKAA
eukprot:CAMPEP_0195108290 /NCGR_PEP_ID=MMETSP0448-20130528/84553_1 /TAXON_ID=66468 /ORGANISM="Heterocapsa triquestra, Strain CCMP 448" /LENGTH=58 /DNA_ID=CAMNT_0040144811 /DNA_START=54 /DNA_END=225 /DNA_ORIENTATION=-